MNNIKELADRVRQTSYDIHTYHGHGHVEKVYENGLCKLGLEVRQQFPINVYDEDGTSIGQFQADLLVEGILVVELKAAKALAPEHEAQILGYLKSSRIQHGLLINFGSYKFEIRKFVWSTVRTENTRYGNDPEQTYSSRLFAFFAFSVVKCFSAPSAVAVTSPSAG